MSGKWCMAMFFLFNYTLTDINNGLTATLMKECSDDDEQRQNFRYHVYYEDELTSSSLTT